MKKIKRNYKKILIIGGIILGIIVIGIILWTLVFSKYKIFHDQEKQFLEEVKHYYSLNKQYLPKKNETREMTLQDLYEVDYINDLYIPKTKKLCDSNSWVRVYQNNEGEYQYTAYLKCGKYESKVDHTGPTIILNGKQKEVISVGSTYKELGVKEVKDDKDGKMSTDSVVIDSSSVDTSKVGSYNVTYTVRDKSYNKTVVTRNVIVAYNLTEEVTKATDKSNYYKGNNTDNYILFSGMLFRIINVNEDGSIRVISDDYVSDMISNYDSYQDSDIDTWLNDVFYKALNNKERYLTSSNYCVSGIDSLTNTKNACDITINSNVGLLSVSDYLNTFDSNNQSYLCSLDYYLLGNKVNDNIILSACGESSKMAINNNSMSAIKPVITLKSNLYLIGGNGTFDNPYRLDDYEFGKENDKMTTRIVGEYFYYSGVLFRITEVNKDNIKAIMAEPLKDQITGDVININLKEYTNLSLDSTDPKNIGYALNNDIIEYFDDTHIKSHDFTIYNQDKNKKYKELSTNKINAKVMLPSSYDLFSSVIKYKGLNCCRFLYSDKSSSDEMVYMLYGANSRGFEVLKTDYDEYAIRLTMYFDDELKIKSGNGTVNSPYYTK